MTLPTPAELDTALDNLYTDALNGSKLYQDPPADVSLRNGNVVPNLRKRLQQVTNAADQLGALDAARDAAAASAAQTALDRIATGADAAAADADRVQTGLDRIQTGLDAASADADATATAADRVVTTADRVQTQADRVQTGLDRIATAADRVQTGLDAATATTKAAEAVVSAGAAAASATEAAGYVPTIATKAEAEAGTNNTKLMTPYLVKEAILAQSRGWRYVTDVALPAANSVLVTGLTPGKQYRIVVNRTRAHNSTARQLQMRCSENGGSSFRTTVFGLSAPVDWFTSNVIRGNFDTGPGGMSASNFSASAGASPFNVAMHITTLGADSVWSDLCDSFELSWAGSGIFTAPPSPSATDNRIFVLEAQ